MNEARGHFMSPLGQILLEFFLTSSGDKTTTLFCTNLNFTTCNLKRVFLMLPIAWLVGNLMSITQLTSMVQDY